MSSARCSNRSRRSATPPTTASSPILVLLFCAAQAPELLGRDQRFGVLPLYFSRALARLDYALAKVARPGRLAPGHGRSPRMRSCSSAGCWSQPDPIEGLRTELPSLGPLIAQASLTSGLLGTISHGDRGVHAAPGLCHGRDHRRVPDPVRSSSPIVSGLLSGSVADWVVVLSPVDVLDGTNAALFETAPDSEAVVVAGLDGIVLRRGRAGRDRRGRRAHDPALPADRGMTEPRSPRWPQPGSAAAGPATPRRLAVDHVSRWYGNVVAVNDISFGLGPGRDRPAGPERRRQVDPAAPAGRACSSRPPAASGSPASTRGATRRRTASSGWSRSARRSTTT